MVQKSRDKDEVRRALAILQLWEQKGCVSAVARMLCAARSSVNRWRALYEEYGEEGITPKPRGRSDWKATDTVLAALDKLVRETPSVYGYLRSRWSSELLSQELAKQTGTAVHATTIRRWLARLALVWRRARPTLCIRDPQKSERMQAIEAALADTTRGTEVFYVDEADINLNPKIGHGWMPRGEQTAVPTPGKNQKRYIAGALHARTGRVVWVQGERKTSLLFINLLYWLKRTYRSARRIVLIADNYIVHKSTTTLRWLARNPKFTLLFQPAYHPWVNRIERLWKALHDTVTRNHQFHSMEALMAAVARFLDVCQPFPGNRHALATA
jgi:transposase